MSYFNYGAKDAKTWLSDKTRKKGASKYNAPLLRAFKTVESEIGCNNWMLYFLLTKCNVADMRPMLTSGTKQKRLVWTIIVGLREYAVTDEYFEILKKELIKIYARCQWVTRIMRENLKLTEYFPYFENGGFDKLIESSFQAKTLEPGVDDSLMAEIEAYNEKHKEEIKAHMESVKPDIERRDRRRAKIEADRKAEIQAAKDLRKSALEEIKEIKMYRNEYEKRKRKIEKELETTIRRV